jgi:hypothetical protein
LVAEPVDVLAQAMLCQHCGAEVEWRQSGFTCPHCGALRSAHNASPKVRERVGDRDGWVCHRCGLPIDRTLASPHPLSRVADHYPITLRDGGPPIPANLKIAHQLCNGDARLPFKYLSVYLMKYDFTAEQREMIKAIALLPLDRWGHVFPPAER